MKLTAEKAREIFIDSLYKESEIDHNKAIIVEGLTIKIGFNPDRLLSHKNEIIELLNELEDDFKESIGGGYTFLNVPFDKHGNQWGEQSDAQELILLGIGIEKVKCLFPNREMWIMLPGGVPYYVILDK